MTSKQKVQVWICCKDPSVGEYRFLMLMTQPARGAFWQPVTGGVEKGESIDEGAAREAFEETGLQTPGGPISLHFHFEFESRGQTVAEYGYYLDVSPLASQSLPQIKLDPHEHSTYQWMDSKAAYSSLIHPSNQDMLKAVLKRLFGSSNS